MSTKSFVIYMLLVVGLLGAGVYFGTMAGKPPYSNLDEFAQCVTDKGFVMYGAAWCQHCQKEKKAFGSSFKYINYVECPLDPKMCTEKKIDGYPTWIIADDQRLEGEQGLVKLAELSSCELRK